MVGIVGALSFGMPVVTAAADTPVGVLKILGKVATFIGASGIGVVAAGPAEVAVDGFGCAATLPLCAAVAAATIGVALYATQDTWVPWVKGAFGGATETLTGSPCARVWCLALVSAPDGSTSDNGATSGYRFTATSLLATNGWYNPEAIWTVTCKSARGTVWAVGQDAYMGRFGGGIDGNVPAGSVRTMAVGGCQNHGGSTDALDYGAVIGLVFNSGGNEGPSGYTWGVTAAITPANTTTSVQVNCVNPDGSTYAVTSAVPLAGDLVKIPTCTGAPSSQPGAHGYCATLAAGATGGTMVEQSSNCPAAGSDAALYPNCAVAGCAYMVIVDGVPCTVGRPGCVDWAATYQGSPGRVGCRYGEYAVKVSSCFFLERVYESSGQPVDGTLANTDGNPATWTGTQPAPNPQPSPQPIPSGAPGGAPGTLPGGLTGGLPSPTGSASTNGDCWGADTFSWNPVDWVVTPVKCAMAWAFLPTAVDTSPVTTQLDRAGIAPSIAALSTAVGSLGGSEGGCQGPSVSFNLASVHQVVTPFAACTAPMSTVASFAYAFVSVVTVLGGAGKIISSIGAGFGFGGPPPTWQQGTLF